MDNDKKLDKARKGAYGLLRSRPRSEAELRLRLKLKGISRLAIDEVVKELKSAGVIDDAKFAWLWIESRMHSNPVGDIVLRHQLKEKGVSDLIIDNTLARKAEEFDEYKIAANMAVEAFSRFSKLSKNKALKRLYDFLYRRGFSYDIVVRVIDDIVKSK